MTTNINRDAQLSTIANAAYLDTPPSTIAIGGVNWERVKQSDSTTSGFYGVAYRNPQTNEIAVAYRGTDGMSDLKADTTFANGGWNQKNWGQIPIDLIVQADSTCERTRYSLFSLSIDQRLVSVSPKPMLVF